MARTGNLGVPVVGGTELPPRYQVIGRIASGGMGTVWCAEDRVLGRDVAIKLLAGLYAHDPAALNRFMREARAAAHLSSHPHVATIYDVGEAVGQDSIPRAFIVMELLPGGTVADALSDGKIQPGEVLRWLHEAASALDFAHRRGVIHRDIKPANLLLDRDRVLYVADFGIARLATEDTITAAGQMLGTASYLAPERALGRPATEASDRYALAVVAFELLVGQRPFTAEHFAAQARAHIKDPPPAASERNPSLPPALDPVLIRGMAKQPEERWPTAEAFADAVERAMDTRGARAAAAGWTPATITRRRSGPPRRSLAIAALLAAIVAIAIAALASEQASSPRHATSTLTVNHQAGKHRHSSTQTSSSTAASSAATTQDQVTGTTSISASQPSASTLETQGHQLMESGNYQAAIPILRRAVAAAGSSSLTYAYALYDLGRSLRLAGDPQAAIPILKRRLLIPNQTGVVRQELLLAERAAGESPIPTTSAGGQTAPGKDHGHGGGNGNGHQQGQG